MNSEVFCMVCENDGVRLDRFLAEQMSGVSRTRAQSLINDGYVTVSGTVQKPSFKLSAGDILKCEVPCSVPIDVRPVNIPIEVVYEDDAIIVVNKPKNMVVHPAPGHFDDTLVNALLYHCGDSLSGINGELRPGIVHRIDKDTTGLLVAAKTNEAHLSLSAQLNERRIKRVYEALVFGVINEDAGTVNAPIGRHEKDRLKMSVNFKHGKEAVTHYKVIERFDKFTRIEARLETGRTHQIRVHMAHIGFPLIGDTVYSKRKQPYKSEGQVLHAKLLALFHPVTGEYITFESELPAYFREILRKIHSAKYL